MDIKNSVIGIVEKHYKNSKVREISLSGDYLTLVVSNLGGGKMPFVALRILRKFPEVRMVHFTGGWIESVYTRNTLRFGGYDI